MARGAHLVGTIPAETTTEAMELAAELLGDALRHLPDGETGPRHDWVKPIVDGLRTHPDLVLVRDGDFSSYDATPRLAVRKGHTLKAGALRFGYADWYHQARPEFDRIKAQLSSPDLRFQIGIPSPFDMAGLVLGPTGALLHRRPFHEATVAELSEIAAAGGDEVVFQVEVPFELVFVVRAPAPLRRLVAALLARVVTAVARDAPVATRFGIHLCLGDLEHTSLIEMVDISPVVALGNAIAAAWPDGRRLDYIHAPFAGAAKPPPSDPAFYRPLQRLRLPGGTRFIAGLVYEGSSLPEQQQVLALVESAYGGEVDVGAACGLGRRSLDDAIASMRRARQLTAA